MSVYNTEDYITESIKSILNQTYSNIEFIIIDDGSTDCTVDKILKSKDSRIKLIRNEENRGLAASLNRGIRQASGAYLARMDADDISHPKRIEKQIEKFKSIPEISLLGTGLQYFNNSKFKNYFPEDHESCKAKLLFNVCFGHPSLMMRSQIFENESNFYNPKLEQYSEDYDLYSRLIGTYRFGNLNELLLRHRTYEHYKKGEAESKRKRNSRNVRERMLGAMGIPESKIDIDTHSLACDLMTLDKKEEYYKIGAWFEYLAGVNNETNYFNPMSLETQLTQQFFLIAYHNPHLSIKISRMKAFSFFERQSVSFSFEIKYLLKKGIALF